MPSTHEIRLEITANDIQSYIRDRRLPGPGIWDPHKVRARIHFNGPHQARMEYWMFRATGSEEFYKDCFRVEAVGEQVVIWYYLNNRKGKRYIDPYNKEEAAKAVFVLNGVEIPDWMRK